MACTTAAGRSQRSMRGTSERAHERSSARAGHGTKRVSGGTSARIVRARKLSVYGTSGGAASRRCSAVDDLADRVPDPAARAEQRRDVDRDGGSGGRRHRRFVAHRARRRRRLGVPGIDRVDVVRLSRSGRGLPNDPATDRCGGARVDEESHEARRACPGAAALQLGAGAGAVVAAAPYLARLERDAVDRRPARRRARSRRSASTGPRRRSSPARSGARTRRCASRAASTTRSSRSSSCTTPARRTTSPTTPGSPAASTPTS